MLGPRWYAGSAATTGLAASGSWPLLEGQPVLAVTNLLVPVAFTLTALVLAGVVGQRPNARLCLATAAAWTLGNLGTHHFGPFPLVEFVTSSVVFAGLAALILRYPDSTTTHSGDRVLVRVVLVWGPALRALLASVSGPADHGYVAPGEDAARIWWPTIGTRPELAETVGRVFSLGGAALTIAFVVAVARRFVAARGLDRPVALPVLVASVALAVAVIADVTARVLPDAATVLPPVFAVECLATLAVPGAFLASSLRRRLAHGAVSSMVTALQRPVDVDAVQDQLRRTLRDPDLTLRFRVPGRSDYVDVAGRPVGPPEDPGNRLVRPVFAADGSELGAIVVDRSLSRHQPLVDAALSAAALALENGRLQATVRAQLEEVHRSRARIVEAGDAERRRLERDLHDGVQQRMLGLKMRLATARSLATNEGELRILDQARDDVTESLAELRAIARGIHPMVLTSAGLSGALQALLERIPLETVLAVPEQRWAPTVEATMYFVVCEALTNSVKHAGAERAEVRISHHDRRLHLLVRDDGRGGARFKDSGGLLGLRDRVAAIEGEFALRSEPGAGTQVTASVPCA